MRWGGLLFVLTCACSAPPTQLVVVVDSDFAVPEELTTVEVEVFDAAGETVSGTTFALAPRGEGQPARFPLPLSFGVVPQGGDASRRVRVVVRGKTATDRIMVQRAATTGFLEGRSLALPMFLLRSCAAVMCPDGQTCTERGCADEERPPETLPPVRPGEELDGSLPDAALRDGEVVDAGDAGEPDAGPLDAGTADGGLDADGGACAPVLEVCNGRDDDCDGVVDEDGCPCARHVHAGRSYLLCSDGRQWAEARSFCEGLGYDLATLTSGPESDFARSLLSGRDIVWIGMSDLEVEGTWRWVDGTLLWRDGATFGYQAWEAGFPADGGAGADCGIVTVDGWRDIRCNIGIPFLCESPNP
ncbi:MAG: lectin-like protein [Myxococcota bacterium]|nr:lectin-like protein [Myxococcota bacterium]